MRNVLIIVVGFFLACILTAVEAVGLDWGD
jgi:hypothetical protein